MVWYYIDCHFEENISELDAPTIKDVYTLLKKRYPNIHIDNVEVL